MLCQLAELEYKVNRISDWRVGGRASRASRLRRDNRPAISGFHPTAHERHGREQRSAIALKLIFGYINRKPSNIVVESIAEKGGDSLLGTKGGGKLLKRSAKRYIIGSRTISS